MKEYKTIYFMSLDQSEIDKGNKVISQYLENNINNSPKGIQHLGLSPRIDNFYDLYKLHKLVKLLRSECINTNFKLYNNYIFQENSEDFMAFFLEKADLFRQIVLYIQWKKDKNIIQ